MSSSPSPPPATAPASALIIVSSSPTTDSLSARLCVRISFTHIAPISRFEPTSTIPFATTHTSTTLATSSSHHNWPLPRRHRHASPEVMLCNAARIQTGKIGEGVEEDIIYDLTVPKRLVPACWCHTSRIQRRAMRCASSVVRHIGRNHPSAVWAGVIAECGESRAGERGAALEPKGVVQVLSVMVGLRRRTVIRRLLRRGCASWMGEGATGSESGMSVVRRRRWPREVHLTPEHDRSDWCLGMDVIKACL